MLLVMRVMPPGLLLGNDGEGTEKARIVTQGRAAAACRNRRSASVRHGRAVEATVGRARRNRRGIHRTALLVEWAPLDDWAVAVARMVLLHVLDQHRLTHKALAARFRGALVRTLSSMGAAVVMRLDLNLSRCIILHTDAGPARSCHQMSCCNTDTRMHAASHRCGSEDGRSELTAG